jgi:hypothetical protein
MMIDWKKIAKPQADGHDATVLKYSLKEKFSHEKTVLGSDFLQTVALEPYTGNFNPGKQPASIDNIRKVESKMNIWPELAHTYEELIEFIIFADEGFGQWNTTNGCSCGHIFFNHKGTQCGGKIGVFVGMLGTLGTLEALAHEAGHLRLHMLGMHIEDHDNSLILNGPDELFESPIRKDKPRPMSAVLQAQYSYVMVSDMDLKYYDAFADEPDKQACAVSYLRANIPRIAKGHDEVKKNVRTTTDGLQFMDGFWEYSDAVIERGLKLIG